jgi:hypothetical protein
VQVLLCSELGKGLSGFPPVLVVAIELSNQRLLIGKLGFAKGYVALGFGEIVQEHVAMHVAIYDDAHFMPVKKTLARDR